MIIKVPPDHATLKGQEELNQLAAMKDKFSKSPNRLTDGRGQRPLKPPAETTFKTFFNGLIHDDESFKPAAAVDEAVQKLLVPNVFAIAKGQETVTAEPGYIATLRMTVEGVRTVVAARALDVVRHLQAAGEPLSALPPKRLNNFLKSATADVLSKFAAPGESGRPKLYHGSVGAGDILFLPSGWLFVERVARTTDHIGVRCSVWFKSGTPIFEDINRWLLAASKPSIILSKAMDAMTVQE